MFQDLYNAYNRKIWLTEVACSGTRDPAAIRRYMEELVPRLEAADYVDRYAWFASRFATQVHILISQVLGNRPGPHPIGLEIISTFFRIGEAGFCHPKILC